MEDLVMAALGGDDAAIERLPKVGADVNNADANGWPPVMGAAGRDHLDMVDRLLAAGAKVGRTAKDGLTALKRTSAAGHGTAVARLEAARSGNRA